MTSSRRSPVIIGVADLPLANGKAVSTSSVLGIQAEVASAAAADAGVTLDQVDGLFTSAAWGVPGPGMMPASTVAEYLGLSPRMVDTTCIGGASFEAHAAHAALALQQGYCDVALITYGSLQRTELARRLGGARGVLDAQYEVPYGLLNPAGAYALAATRYLHEFGATPEELAMVAVATREWARLNPAATKRDPLTVDDVLASPMLSDPLHALDCCLVTDGAGAIILTTEEHASARTSGSAPVRLRGFGEATEHNVISQMADLTRSPAGLAARRALDAAGIAIDGIDVFEVYDSFTITVLLTLEALGICGPGEAAKLVASGATAPGGEVPLNTNGGGLSCLHPGMYGIFLLIEAARQLRGDAGDRQVPGARTALVNGTGGVLSSAAACVLSSV
ncbi:MAG: thiolase [Frankiales bacterium]|nr:thiolase [Frankiales bacterium]